MFSQLGSFISRWWVLVLGIWLAALIGLRLIAPNFDDLATGGEFVFLPEHMASRQAERLLNRAFPDRSTSSNVVVVLCRDEEDGLADNDRDFIDSKLKPSLEKMRDQVNSESKLGKSDSEDNRLITGVHTFSSLTIGTALVSHDLKSTLVMIELATDFRDLRNAEVVAKVENIVKESMNDLPKGLQVGITGSATLGRDMTDAEERTAQNTGPLTIAMVIILLVVIYRAPLLALVPLLTLFFAVDISLNIIALLAQAGYLPIFRGLQVYTTVLTYGPGVDYCLFFIARYKENLHALTSSREAVSTSVGQVGAAITASAATVVCGIAMLTFAEFGKFHQAGMSISLALAITLIATLTLTPALLYLTGRWTFWPYKAPHPDTSTSPAVQSDSNDIQSGLLQNLWTHVGRAIERKPARFLFVTIGCMLPFALLGISIFGNVNYGLFTSLPKSTPSSAGAVILEKDFPAGITGPIEILIQNSKIDFGESDGIEFVDQLVERLLKRRTELHISDIRSVSDPLGTTVPLPSEDEDESSFTKSVKKKATLKRSIVRYVSSVPEFDGHLTEIEVILSANPFSIESIHLLERIHAAIIAEIPADQLSATSVSFLGPTASVRDLSIVSQNDQIRIFTLVFFCVLFILVVLLRSITLSVFLLLTVLLSYIATLGVTWLLFYSLDPHDFIGLDWTVAIFLFVVLIAVGEDYNIFLVTRIHEEQKQNGARHGIIVALTQTGGIITSCGFVMAGTFLSLCFGSLIRMQQLGFALAFGVLLDTFVVRPILVPAFLMVMNDRPWERLNRTLKQVDHQAPTENVT